ncbi:MAG: nucleotidyltransferase family protein [Hyphomonadaceae bacterium]|nr:nucleotidyltransferase family protein [Hyphomonadaceae bacterium]
MGGFISAHPQLCEPLEAVSRLSLPDCWVAAGFIRNAVWDRLHDRPFGASQGDVDVIYFDAVALERSRDREIEAACRAAIPGLDWSVKNQARMHLRNGDSPYLDTAHAMTHWPETATAIGARWRNGMVEVLAPFGVDDLLSLRVRPTPAFQHKLQIYRNRLSRKRWRARWPNLVVFDDLDDLGA